MGVNMAWKAQCIAMERFAFNVVMRIWPNAIIVELRMLRDELHSMIEGVLFCKGYCGIGYAWHL